MTWVGPRMRRYLWLHIITGRLRPLRFSLHFRARFRYPARSDSDAGRPQQQSNGKGEGKRADGVAAADKVALPSFAKLLADTLSKPMPQLAHDDDAWSEEQA